MSNEIGKVIKQTFLNLKDKSILATPSEYNREFCQVAKEFQVSVTDCKRFQEFIAQLNDEEQKEVKKRDIQTPEEIIPILLERIAKKNISTLGVMLSNSLAPSISLQLDENLAKFNVKIGDAPALIFEEDIQKEMQAFISKRFEADKAVVKQKTEDIAKLVTLMGKYLKDAISTHANGTENVSGIKEQIKAIDLTRNNPSDLSELQNRLVNAVETIESEMTQVNKNLESGKSHVDNLQDKIKVLESQLEVAQKESATDHLTGLLTRRSYEKEIKRVESDFTRNNKEFAVVFFDIDHFKKVNDTYGHDAGDSILKTFAKILQSQTRETDVLCRYGGEEFVAVVQFKLKRELLGYLKRIKSIVEQNKFVHENKKIHISFSAGVALRNKYKIYEDAVHKADELLYEAKKSGRDKIVIDDGNTI
ncbi:MAG: GGDEF domain-containing protein [Candidatus Marinarcus sp.]|uniref:GGDEF domain-containing protein n=1 Tax=Candidatus Marinarcus sp. TaxID=3100987 RepID=UPI003AFFEBE9